MIPVLLAVVAVLGFVVRLRRRFLVVTVRGASMEPAFRDGQRVLTRRCRPEALRTGDVAVFHGPAEHADLLIKRVAALPGERVPAEVRTSLDDARVPRDSLVVLGDNRRASQDSRHYGYVAAGRLVGTVIRTM
ncbi:S26 family signal peptidase [Acrocarpospora phusangensis]|uniref:Signal peptidase I n=1 Tax=Acrocarpospora phusangensis TaxID=1070424 RepID=A0A919QES6_9ACTN|nr:signal peptidase I [Acrocarpospora phusangensis]GIH25210.1 S26 family signal peptidase [Acrocarpospora phusangensis]